MVNSKKSTSSRADSPVSHSATPGEGRAREMTAISGLKCLELYEKSNPLTSWQRMFLVSLLGTKAFFSKLSTLTWRLNSTKLPRRLYFRLLPSAPYIEGIGSGFVPTPDSTTGAPNKNSNKKRGPKALIDYARSPKRFLPTPRAIYGEHPGMTDPSHLTGAIHLWPTPTSRDRKDGSAESCKNVPVNSLLGRTVHQWWRTPQAGDGTHNHCDAPAHKRGTVPLMLTVQAQRSEGKTGGSLNPTWVEWLMGFPLGWTDLEDSGTPSSHKSRSG